MKLYITYGSGSDRANCYSVVEGTDYAECREIVNNVTHGKFAFDYTEDRFVGQVERFDLTKVELGPQVTI